MKIYNTLTRSKEEFVPIQPDRVGIYTCGPTVYRDAHIGNMRAYHFADLLRNTLKNILGYKVTHVVNITDVGHLVSDGDQGEDKLEKGSKREGISAWDVALKYEQRFHKFLAMLNISPFDVYPRATEHIAEQIQLIQILESKGCTYIIPGDGVYMDTSKVDGYGSLAKLDIDGLDQGARIENDNKKNKTDFALRKFSPIGEQRQMERESPRGIGFPGRHIECSAMSSKYLGNHFDIHTGGVDHIPVHHTNEIAQSECAFGHDHGCWVNYWMHIQFLNLGGKKVSKSAGGLVTVDDVVAKGYSPLDLRYLYFTGHYRNFLDFNRESLEVSKNSRQNLIKKIQKIFNRDPSTIIDFDINMSYEKLKDKLTSSYVGDALEEMVVAISDDLNTPQLIAIINQSLASIEKYEQVDKNEMLIVLHWLEKNLLKIGLFDTVLEEKIEIPADVIQFADQRIQAKKDKDYALADELRTKVLELGFQIKDTKDGYEIIK